MVGEEGGTAAWGVLGVGCDFDRGRLRDCETGKAFGEGLALFEWIYWRSGSSVLWLGGAIF